MSQHALDLGVPTHAGHRSRLCPLPVGHERRPRPGQQGAQGPTNDKFTGDKKQFIEDVRQACTPRRSAATPRATCSCEAAAKEYNWPLNYGNIALLWRGGCIIRAAFLERHQGSLRQDPKLENLLLAPYFFTKRGRKGPAGLAHVVVDRGRAGPAGPGLQHGPRLLRRLPPRPPAGQPAASPARLLRRPHLQRTDKPRGRRSTPTGFGNGRFDTGAGE